MTPRRRLAPGAVIVAASLVRGLSVATVLCSLALAACVPLLGPKGRFVRPHVSFVDARLGQVTASGFLVLVDLNIVNAAEESLRVAGYVYRASVNHVPVASGEDPSTLELPPQATVPVTVPVNIQYRDLREALSRTDWLQGGMERLMLTVSGTFTVERFGLRFPIPFSFERPLKKMTRGSSKDAPLPPDGSLP